MTPILPIQPEPNFTFLPPQIYGNKYYGRKAHDIRFLEPKIKLPPLLYINPLASVETQSAKTYLSDSSSEENYLENNKRKQTNTKWDENRLTKLLKFTKENCDFRGRINWEQAEKK